MREKGKSVKAVSRKTQIRNTAVLLLLGGLACFVPGYFSVTMTDSVNHRVFFVNRHSRNCHPGDYVLFSLPPTDPHYPSQVVVKKVRGAAGDVIRQAGRKFYLNEQYICAAKEYTLKGDPIDATPFQGKLAKEEIFVLGEKKDSYDSRYFGPVNREQLIGVAYGLF
jgi:conjugal transfer pilin signal peptidase TrbI